MRFEQTLDILQHQVIEYHRTVSRLYHDFAGQELSPRNRLMIDFLVEHELRLALALHDFMDEAPTSVLDYWFKRIEIPFPLPAENILTDACRTDLDQLVSAAISCKSALIAYYDHLLLQCDTADATALFQALKTQEENGMKRFIRHAQGLEDL